MDIGLGTLTRCAMVIALSVGLAMPVGADEPKAGEVRRVEGTALVERSALPQPAALKTKSEVLYRDLLSTGEQSKAEMLMGGKAIVTMRELSKLRVTDAPPVSTVDLSDGRMKLALRKTNPLKPGERIDIRTPNAVTAVRGTTVVLEVLQTTTGAMTILTVLEGFVDMTPLDPATGRPSGPPVRVNDLEQTTVIGSGQAGAPVKIPQADAERLDKTFAFKLLTSPPNSQLLQKQTNQAASDASKLPPPGVGGTTGGTPVVTGDDIRRGSGGGGSLPPTGGRPSCGLRC
jgi:FecR-like protein